MNTNLTDITLVIDRSGSMEEIRADAEGGVNLFVSEQAKQLGEALLTLLQFDTEYEFLHTGLPIWQVPKYTLVPRGGTALLDAVGRAINETGERLAKIPEQHRPGLVIFVVMTDGEENSSKEFSKSCIKEMIQHQQEKYNWHFTFLGANQDAFAEAGGIGIEAAGVAVFSPHQIGGTYKALASKVSRMRAQQREGETVINAFTETERKEMVDVSTPGTARPGGLCGLVMRAWDIFHRAQAHYDDVVVQPSIPILFFGDSAAYFASPIRGITVGLNPSNMEFPDSDPFRRFPRAGKIDSSDGQLDGYIVSLDEYFTIHPYRKWFNCYEPVLSGMHASYYSRADSTAVHTDICSPIATNPTWSGLPSATKQALLKDGQELWHGLVRALEPDVIIASIAKQYAARIEFPHNGLPRELFTIDGRNPYVVTIEDIQVGTRPTRLVWAKVFRQPFGGVTNEDKRRIGAALREALDA